MKLRFMFWCTLIVGLTFGVSCGLAQKAGNERVESGPKRMALIPASTFEMGTEEAKLQELLKKYKTDRKQLFTVEMPKHTVTLDSYYFDKYEVTNKEFRQFVEKNSKWEKGRLPEKFDTGKYLDHWDGLNYPEGEGDFPVININWYSAMAYCKWLGKRLPTEAEWEYAARGNLKGKEYPWGNDLDTTKANYGASKLERTTKVGSYPANGYGIYDTSGNVWEYLADAWSEYDSRAKTNPVAGGDVSIGDRYRSVTTRRVVRGGSWGGSPVNLRVTYRDSHKPDDPKPFVGFRCAVSAKDVGLLSPVPGL